MSGTGPGHKRFGRNVVTSKHGLPEVPSNAGTIPIEGRFVKRR